MAAKKINSIMTMAIVKSIAKAKDILQENAKDTSVNVSPVRKLLAAVKFAY